MFFAVFDYLSFRSRQGRYSRNNSSEPMSYGFEGCIPEEIIQTMQPGDAILFASFNWWVSWLIMYITSSQVSHLAMYIGNRRIIHATLSGAAVDPIESLCEPKARILVTRLPLPPGTQDSINESKLEGLLGTPYSYKTVIIKGLRILSGRDWPAFRWKFFADFAVVFLVLDIPFWLTLKFPVASVASVILLGTVLINSVIWRVRPLPRFQADTGSPKDMLEIVVRIGGRIILDKTRLSQ